MSDDLTDSFITGFQERSIARDSIVQQSAKEHREARQPLVDQVQEAYPEVDVSLMESDEAYGGVSNASRYLTAAVGGIREGWQEAIELVHMAGYALSGQKQFLQRPPTLEEVAEEAPDLPEVEVGDTMSEQAIKGITQFLSTGGPAGGALKKTGMGMAKAGMAGGAIGDATAFDPKEGNLFTLMNEVGLENDFTQWMDSSTDGEFEGRFKNALEGAGIGKAFGAIFDVAKKYKASATTASGGAVAADEGQE